MARDFERIRRGYRLKTADVFRHGVSNISAVEAEDGSVKIKSGFNFSFAGKRMRNLIAVFSGSVPPGGHNCIVGLLDAMAKWSKSSIIYGAAFGIKGLLRADLRRIGRGDADKFANMGGCGMLGSGERSEISEDQAMRIAEVCRQYDADSLVVIGAGALRAVRDLDGHFRARGIGISAIAIPGTMTGFEGNGVIDFAFGMDTVSKFFCELIGNIQSRALSFPTRYHLLGLSAPDMPMADLSRVLLECALRCHCNLTLLGDEIEAKGLTLDGIADALADCVKERKVEGKNSGVIIFPNGVLDCASDVRALVQELAQIPCEAGLSSHSFAPDSLADALSPSSLNALNSIPRDLRPDFLKCCAARALDGRKSEANGLAGSIAGDILAKKTGEKMRDYYFRCETYRYEEEAAGAFPTDFDCAYAYNLGFCAFALCLLGRGGHAAAIFGLEKKLAHWQGLGLPVSHLPGARSCIQSPEFKAFRSKRTSYIFDDSYHFPGPIGFGQENFDLPSVITIAVADAKRRPRLPRDAGAEGGNG